MIAALSLFYYAFCALIQYSRHYDDTKLSTPNRQLSTLNSQLYIINVLLLSNTAFS